MKVSNARLGVWAWMLIYGGMFAFALGVALAQAGTGPQLWVAGIALVVAGLVLIGVRSRRVTRDSRAALAAVATPSTSSEAPP